MKWVSTTSSVLPMASRAAGQLSRAADVVLFDQLSPERTLIAAGLPRHIENLLARAQIGFRIAVAIETPFHLQRLVLPHQRHAIDAAVASDAADSLIDVNAVIEINEVGQVVNPGPTNRHAGLKTVAHRLQDIAGRPDLRVTAHAGRRRRQSGERRFFDRAMAIAAVDAQSGDMMFMTKRHRLSAHDIGFGDKRRTIDLRDQPQQPADEKHHTKDTQARQSIGAAMKYLRH